jgi:hypothetical protein
MGQELSDFVRLANSLVFLTPQARYAFVPAPFLNETLRSDPTAF